MEILVQLFLISTRSRPSQFGPVAGFPWVEGCIQYALQYLEPEKISLGFPGYSRQWYLITTPEGSEKLAIRSPTYSKVQEILSQKNLTPIWDEEQKVHYVTYLSEENKPEYLYIEDVRSFEEKLTLISKYKLEGASIWRLGQEDPQIFNILEPLVEKEENLLKKFF